MIFVKINYGIFLVIHRPFINNFRSLILTLKSQFAPFQPVSNFFIFS